MGEDEILERIRERVAEFRKTGVWNGPMGMESILVKELTHLLELYDTQSEELWNYMKEIGSFDNQ